MDTNATGRFIAELRKQKGYTQKELAEKLMVTDKAVSRWETGKGLPDTSLLKPLADILGVSVEEILFGKLIDEERMKDQADKIILEALNYSRRMLSITVRVILLIVSVAFMISPLFTASQNYVWIVGIVIAATVILYTCLRKKYSFNITKKAYYLVAVLLQIVALVLEILPIGAVMVFSVSPTERITETYSYFSLLPWGYANFTPMLTGILTIVIILLGIISLIKFEKAQKCKKEVFICSIVALLFSIVPLFLYGTVGMTSASYAVSALIFLSLCMQAVANRQE